MKKMAAVILAVMGIIFFGTNVSMSIAEKWEFSQIRRGSVESEFALAIDPEKDKLAIAYSTGPSVGELEVIEKNGNRVGMEIVSEETGNFSIAFSPVAKKLYLAYEGVKDLSSNGLIVKRLRDNKLSWEIVGGKAVSEGEVVLKPKIIFDPITDQPYVVYKSSHKISIKKFDGEKWINAGDIENPDWPGGQCDILDFDAAFNPATKELNVIFSSGKKIYIWKLIDSSWVASFDFPVEDADNIQMIFGSKSDEIFVSYQDFNGDSTIIKKFNGRSWSGIFQSQYVAVMEFNPYTDELFVMSGPGGSDGVDIKKFNHGKWVILGTMAPNSEADPDIYSNMGMLFSKNVSYLFVVNENLISLVKIE